MKNANDKKRYKRSRNYSAKLRYTEGVLQTLHRKGLYNNFNYYYAAFHLGRYFRYCLEYDENQVKEAIEVWIKRHFKEKCDEYNLIPFLGAFNGGIKKPYDQCVDAASRNCLKGFRSSVPLSKWINIYPGRASKYINGLPYSNKQKNALLNLVDYAGRHNTLTLYLSYSKLLWIFDTTSRNIAISNENDYQVKKMFKLKVWHIV